MNEGKSMTATSRYKAWAIGLHWTIAALILFQIGYAWWVLGAQPDHSPSQRVDLAFHMSIGLTILVLSLARLTLRLTVRPPPLPADMPGWEKGLARVTHVVFYLLIIGIPLGGWTLASLNPRPILYFGLFTWPHLPVFAGLTAATKHILGGLVGPLHTSILIWATLVLLGLHVAGALKNQVTGPPVLWRMIPFLRRPSAL